jgi:hypothetical protein
MSCTCGAEDQARQNTIESRKAQERAAMNTPPPAGWRRHVIAALGIRVDFFDGAEVSEGTVSGMTYSMQSKDDVTLGVWSGPGQDLAGFRARYGPPRRATFGEEQRLTVCEQSAVRQEAAVAEEESATALIVGPDGSLGHRSTEFPALVSVGVALRIRDKPVLVAFTVSAAKREAHREEERHFFASIACE